MWESRQLGTMALAILGWCAVASAGRVWFVAGDAGNTGDGLTWDAPFERLEDAITASRLGDEIWVKAGVYVPASDDATASFALKSGVAIYGGFAGNEELREQRDWHRYPTRLSGDLAGDDQIQPHTAIGANSGHIVACGAVNASAVLDGFIIEHGAGGPPGTPTTSALAHGSGMYCLGGSPTIRNCTFRENIAPHKSGGAVYVLSGHPTFEDCRFEENTALNGGGGALCAEGDSSLTLSGCVFVGNLCVGGAAGFGGGAVLHNASGALMVHGCHFEHNASLPSSIGPLTHGLGGALAITQGSAFVHNSTLRYNEAPLGGGGIASGASIALENCLVANNVAHEVLSVSGDAPATGGGLWTASPSTTLTNCTLVMNEASRAAGVDTAVGAAEIANSIVWGNQTRDETIAGLWQEQLGQRFELRHCCVSGLFQPGPIDDDAEDRAVIIACISANPGFVDPAAGDFRLSRTSPCVDAGEAALVQSDVQTDLDGAPRLVALRDGPVQIDMGCFERTSIAGCYEMGDADGDGTVNVGDLNHLLIGFGSRGADLPADLNDDRLVDVLDLNIMLLHWGEPCVAAPPPIGAGPRIDDAVIREERDRAPSAERLVP